MPETPQEIAAETATPFEIAERILAKCRKRRLASVADVETLARLVAEMAMSETADAREVALLDGRAGALRDEYGILDHGGGMREARTEPLPLPEWNAALMVKLRAEGIFDAGGRRPATLMRRKATDWAEVPNDVNPADIFAGYASPRKADA